MKRATLSGLLALACALPAVAGTPPRAPAVPFMHDDYPRALSEARARGVPIFVEAWAPW